jgi:hypothetical protein
VPLETEAAVLAEPAVDRVVKRSRACHGEFRTHFGIPRCVPSGRRYIWSSIGMHLARANMVIMAICEVAVGASIATMAEVPNKEELEALRNAVQSTGNSGQVGEKLRAFFQRADAAQLLTLRKDTSATIALFASWEASRRAAAKDELTRLNEFLLVLQERINAPIPEFWGAKLAEQVSVPTNDLLLSQIPKKSSAQVWGPAALRRRNDKDMTILVRGRNTLAIPNKLFEEVEKKFTSLAVTSPVNAWIGDDRSILIQHDRFGAPFPIFCLDTKSVKVIWQSEVWNADPLVGLAGWVPPRDHVLVVSEKTVAVMGIGPFDTIYVDAFDLSSGKVLLRFSPGYWNMR